MDFWFFVVFRVVAGMGIGGEYAAINSAIDEFILAKYRGRVDISINGTYWGGAALGAVANMFLLNTADFPVDWGWRIGFFIGPVIGILIIFVRRTLPESPRWQMTHGRLDEAEAMVEQLEETVTEHMREQKVDPDWTLPPVSKDTEVAVKQIPQATARHIVHILFRQYPRRTLVGATMMITQSFLYTAIFFPFAIGNLLGPLLLGRLFDTWGRRQMILLTYGLAGVTLAVSAGLFHAGVLSALTQTILWCIAFFFASAGASSAYLGAGMMIAGGLIAFVWGIDAAGKSLENITTPLGVEKKKQTAAPAPD